jgi:hypothetical protein
MIFIRWRGTRWHIFADPTTLCGREIPRSTTPESMADCPPANQICSKCNSATKLRRSDTSAQKHLENTVHQDIIDCQLAEGCKPQHVFHPQRKWAFDFSWPRYKIALEVNGGTYMRGRHSRGAGQRKDYEKWSEASLLGWLLILVDSKDVSKKVHIERIQRAMEVRQIEIWKT